MFDKNFKVPSHHISKEEYIQIAWMNTVPEIVCDVLAYLGNYVHYRTDKLQKHVYHNMLQNQVQCLDVMSSKQIMNFEREGWMYSTDGLQKHVDELDFDTLKKQLAPTKDEHVYTGKLNALKRIESLGLCTLKEKN